MIFNFTYTCLVRAIQSFQFQVYHKLEEVSEAVAHIDNRIRKKESQRKKKATMSAILAKVKRLEDQDLDTDHERLKVTRQSYKISMTTQYDTGL